jgi:hypothetical protein
VPGNTQLSLSSTCSGRYPRIFCAAGWGVWMSQAMTVCKGSEPKTILDLELGEDGGKVVPHRRLGDA